MIHKRTLDKKGKDALIGKISDVLKKKENLIFAYIFGSFISEDHFKDLDIGIFVSNRIVGSPLRLELEIEGELEDAVHIPVDVRIINNAPLPFVYNVLKSGFLIVDNNRHLRADFAGLVYKKYFDFQYLRNEYLREIINAPV